MHAYFFPKKYIAAQGEPGSGGPPGKGVDMVDIVFAAFHEVYYKWSHTQYCGVVEEWRERTMKWIADGTPGVDGSNDVGIEKPTTGNFSDLPLPINTYKSLLREHLPDSVRSFELKALFNDIEEREEIQKFYNSIGLINDFRSIEDQYLGLKKRIDFVPQIHSLLKRTTTYARTIQEPDENRIALRILYTALLSKIVQIGQNENRESVVDLYEYLKLVQENIVKLSQDEREENWQKYQTEYKDVMDGKTKTALELIETQLKPAIDKSFRELNELTEQVIKDIKKLIENAAKEIAKLEEKKRELERAAIKTTFMTMVNFAVGIAGLGGPVLSAAAKAIAAGIELNMPKRAAYKDKKPLYEFVKEGKGALSVVRIALEQRHKEFLMYLDVVEEKLKNVKEKWANNIRGEVSVLRVNVSTQITDSNMIDPRRVEQFTEKLAKTADANKPTKSEQAAAWNAAKDVIGFIDKGFGKDIVKLQDSINEVNEAIAKQLGKILKLQKSTRKVLDVMVPMVLQLQKDIDKLQNDLDNDSHVELDIAKWNLKGSLRVVKTALREMSEGTETQADLTDNIDQLEETLSLLINIHDRIESYNEHAQFAKYMANMITGGTPSFQNPALGQAVATFRKTIRRNIVLQQYEVGIRAVKQHLFPFANFILSAWQLPPTLDPEDIEQITQTAVTKIKDVTEQVKLMQVTVGKYDKDIFGDVHFGRSTDGENVPFYQWKYDEIKNEINNFFHGEEILLKADIKNAYPTQIHAIKFNMIDFTFAIANQELQKELDSLLVREKLGVKMSMVGNSYYGCNGKSYYISVDDNVVFEYSFEKMPGTYIPKVKNEVYRKIMEKGYFLAPYTMWKIKLVKSGISVYDTHKKVEKFLNSDLRIEIAGRGQYFQDGASVSEVCNEDLADFYPEDMTTSIPKAADSKMPLILSIP